MAIADELKRLNEAAGREGYWLHRASVPRALAVGQRMSKAGLSRCSLKVRAGRIERIVPAAEHEPAARDIADGSPSLDLDGGLLVCAWVDAHTHLDKGHISPRTGECGGDLLAAIAATQADAAHWTPEDLARRMAFSLRSAYAHGTRAMRTHIDWVSADAPPAWEVAHAFQRDWRDRIELQCAALCPPELFAHAGDGERIARAVANRRAVLGAFVYPMAGVEKLVDRVFALAERFDLWLDFHVDEHLQPNVDATRAILAAARRTGMGHRVLCGHCCSLGVVAPATASELLAEFASVGATIVSLPFTNLYLQDRRALCAPRMRGLAPLREAHTQGVKLALASDNHRDPFLPFGDLDPLQTLALASYAAHLEQPFERWIQTVTTTPATALGLPWDGVLREGAPADLVLLRARDSMEACSRPQGERRVVRAGRFIETVLPDYRELDAPQRCASARVTHPA